eukprot:Rmarinus@m.3250
MTTPDFVVPSDPRVGWVKSRVCLGLEIEEEAFDGLFDPKKVVAGSPDLLAWLDAKVDYSAIVFYSVEEEVEVEVKVPKPKPEVERDPDSEVDDDDDGEGGEGGTGEGPGDGENKGEAEGDSGEGTGDGDKAAADGSVADGGDELKDDAKSRDESPKEGGEDGTPVPDGESPKPGEEGEGGSEKNDEYGSDAGGSEDGEKLAEPEFIIKYELRTETQVRMCFDTLPENIVETRCTYFLRNLPDAIPIPPEVSAVDDVLTTYLEYGVLCGHSLAMLEQAISQVFLPLLSQASTGEGSGVESAAPAQPPPSTVPPLQGQPEGQLAGDSKISDAVKNEFLGNMQKFTSQISHAIQQVNGDVRLRIPAIVIEDPDKFEDETGEVAQQIETALEEWTPAIAQAIEQQLKKEPVGKGPLAEIEFWRERNAALSTINEQLYQDRVKNMIIWLEENGNSALLPNFKDQLQELTKYYIEAKDNVKFLTTLERHFKNISQGSLTTIIDTLPSMMNAIRMVWVISRHYNRDERMVPLMKRIADEIADKVAAVINVKHVLRQSPAEAMKTISLAKQALLKWSETYFAVREKNRTKWARPALGVQQEVAF